MAFFKGLSPYLLNYIFNNLEIFGDPDHEIVDKRGKYWFYFTILLWNPLNILVVRMQCVEFPHPKLRHAVLDMLKHDSYRMFYKGLVPIFTGQVQLYFFMTIANTVNNFYSESKYTPYVCLGLFLAGCAMAHPWYLIGMRVQYNSRFDLLP